MQFVRFVYECVLKMDGSQFFWEKERINKGQGIRDIIIIYKILNTATNPTFHFDYHESLLRMRQRRDRVEYKITQKIRLTIESSYLNLNSGYLKEKLVEVNRWNLSSYTICPLSTLRKWNSTVRRNRSPFHDYISVEADRWNRSNFLQLYKVTIPSSLLQYLKTWFFEKYENFFEKWKSLISRLRDDRIRDESATRNNSRVTEGAKRLA